ncbi:hypothetical protein CR513_54514, partial [Mucuna pruriens]
MRFWDLRTPWLEPLRGLNEVKAEGGTDTCQVGKWLIKKISFLTPEDFLGAEAPNWKNPLYK